jgi:hypothetical protein
MKIKDVFEVGEIMEWEDKSAAIKTLTRDDCEITGKTLNRNKIILHLKRKSDGSEGNVFVKLREESPAQFPISRKLLGSKKVMGLSLSQFEQFEVEEL